jgi:hypothetical protein
MMRRQFVTWRTTHNEFGTGSWAVIDGILTVRTADGTKSAPFDNVPADILARLLMWEMQNEAAA